MTAVDPQLLVTLLGQAYDRKSWHGPTLGGALHAAYWKYIVRRRLSGDRRGSFPLKGSNWFPRPVAGTAAEWAETRTAPEDKKRQSFVIFVAMITGAPPG